MANQPIDCSRTHYESTQCVGCPAYVVIAQGFTGVAMCLECRRSHENIDWEWFTPLGEWHPEVGYPAPGSGGVVSDGKQVDFGPAEYETGPNLTPFALVDTSRVFRCIRCREQWPMVVGLTPEEMVRGFADHDRVAHQEGVWLVGGPGGADENVCAPCGGGDRDKRPLPGGPDHSLCLKGKTKGWGGRCGCQHRSRAELDAIVGKNRPNWRPNRWSDPKIVELAAENVQNRWNQPNLWGEPS
jgi:hypothetical protein